VCMTGHNKAIWLTMRNCALTPLQEDLGSEGDLMVLLQPYLDSRLPETGVEQSLDQVMLAPEYPAPGISAGFSPPDAASPPSSGHFYEVGLKGCNDE